MSRCKLAILEQSWLLYLRFTQCSWPHHVLCILEIAASCEQVLLDACSCIYHFLVSLLHHFYCPHLACLYCIMDKQSKILTIAQDNLSNGCLPHLRSNWYSVLFPKLGVHTALHGQASDNVNYGTYTSKFTLSGQVCLSIWHSHLKHRSDWASEPFVSPVFTKRLFV